MENVRLPTQTSKEDDRPKNDLPSNDSSNSTSSLGQILLKRHPSTTEEAFKSYYTTHHGPLALPYFLATGVQYYAQLHHLHWTSPTAASQQHPDVDLADWDAAAECVFGPGGPPGANDGPVAKAYYERVVLPDERRFLVGEAVGHMRVLPRGSVGGERVEFIVGRRVVGDEGEWAWARGLWEGVKMEVEGLR